MPSLECGNMVCKLATNSLLVSYKRVNNGLHQPFLIKVLGTFREKFGTTTMAKDKTGTMLTDGYF
jgi:hypothetical protein